MTARVRTGRLSQYRNPHLRQHAGLLLIALILVLFVSSCGSSGSTNPPVPIASSPAPAGGNPGVPEPSATPAPDSNPGVPEPPASSAPAATVTASGVVDVPQGQVAKVFAEPLLSSTVVRVLPDGADVEILCTAQGDEVTNDSGTTSSLWDDTQYGYLPDVVVNTGSNSPVAPSCS
jgi:hypothetical protein